MTSASVEEDLSSLSLTNMVIGSVDTLRETELAQEIPNTWNDRPPLLIGPKNMEESPILLKGMIRKGIPPALRCAVWLSNVIQTVHPHQDANHWHEYRTLSKVRALDGAYKSVTDQISTDKTYWATVSAPNYGQIDPVTVPDMTEHGRVALTRVLVAIERITGLEVAPLVPTLTALLLTNMSESYAFCTVREMVHAVSWYFPVSRREYSAWCRAFGDVMRKLHKATASYLEDRLVLDVGNMAPMFQDCWVGILPLEYILRIMDIYTLEGLKVLFRFAVALLVLYKIDAAEQLTVISNANDWWEGMRNWAHSSRFHFELVVRKAYGLHGKGLRRQLRFPRRHILQRIIRMEEERVQTDDESSQQPATPVGLIMPDESSVPFGEEVAKPILVQSMDSRQRLAEWLPITLRMTNLELLYSTNHHGRAMERFYTAVKNAKHTLLLCEAYAEDVSGSELSSKPTIIGLYASQAWRPSSKVYGDGACFLFRLDPNPQCWKWTPKAPGSSHGNALDGVDLENDDNNQTALLEQFMVGTRTYISMGGNTDGSAGLRFNEDFTKGESSTAVGFENEPLHGLHVGSVFEVGLVEVYRFVRQIDGRAT